MEEYDLIEGEVIPVVGVENFSVARDVIKSLRSSSNSNRFYKQNATRDNFLIENLDEFNKVVNVKAATLAFEQKQEDKMNESIAYFKPPIRYIVPKNTATNNGKILYNPSPAVNSKDYDDFSSDDEQQKTSPSKFNKSPKYDDGDEYDLNGDSSDEDSWKPSSKRKNNNSNSPPQNNLPKMSNKSKTVSMDDDLDFGDDDEMDNAELFSSFVAPVSLSSKNNSTKSNFNSTTSSVTSMSKSAKVQGATGNAKSVGKGGSAGIRGIQELLKEPNAFNFRSQSPSVNLLSSIKPGQAIRVKAPGKRRNHNSSNGEEY